MPTEADTCRTEVVPRLQAAGWDDDPHSIAEPRTITDGRIVPVGKGFIRKSPKRVDYLLRTRATSHSRSSRLRPPTGRQLSNAGGPVGAISKNARRGYVPNGIRYSVQTVRTGVSRGLTAQGATMQAENRCKRSANTVLQSSDRCINVNVGLVVGRVEVVMKFPMAALIALTLVGCSPAAPSPPSPNPTTPTLDSPSPSPSPPGSPAANYGWIWAMAVDRGGGCIADATFEIVSGQGPIGDIIRQETPCSVWDIGGGIMLRNLTTGVAMTLRASAPGYKTVERSLFPKLAGTVDEFVLDRQ